MDNQEILEKLFGYKANQYKLLGSETVEDRKYYICALKDEKYYSMILMKNLEERGSDSKLNFILDHERLNDKVMKIADIQVYEKCKGQGSILMKYAINYLCTETDIRIITGFLSQQDADHFERLEHFYKKFGFQVSFAVDMQGNKISGKIKKIIK
ncbi:Hpothetical protein [Clostridium bornimense]|uniref:Hpothetical protein n=1 Tax=Clostridium bornimense TaxID=1216932 RepID=W6SFG7_9CLOT|nr:GNAT family N-acetyltransferase [Clostridium bornimense]CDM68425.1 Hpothetical protein [Clostridium bornimense]